MMSIIIGEDGLGYGIRVSHVFTLVKLAVTILDPQKFNDVGIG